ncbi:hypothetical protein F4776DRAFT_315788 [Hypoxylon sp. NC0597]|nr:hypothetical protein F4776DRAFT_315788 [Hypoxylon sp. NC0597]
MSSVRSYQAVQGSAEPGSHPKAPEDPQYADARVSAYMQDTAKPVIVQTPSTKLNSLFPRDFSEVFSSVVNLSDCQAAGTPAQPQTSNDRSDIASTVKFAEGGREEPPPELGDADEVFRRIESRLAQEKATSGI